MQTEITLLMLYIIFPGDIIVIWRNAQIMHNSIILCTVSFGGLILEILEHSRELFSCRNIAAEKRIQIS